MPTGCGLVLCIPRGPTIVIRDERTWMCPWMPGRVAARFRFILLESRGVAPSGAWVLRCGSVLALTFWLAVVEHLPLGAVAMVNNPWT